MKTQAALLLSGVLAVGALSASAQTLTHVYQLNDSYADSLGGPSLVSLGGTVGPGGYTSPGLDEGLTLTGAIDPTSYSIQMVFNLPAIPSGYDKLIDFANRASDDGLYSFSGELNLFNDGIYTPVFTANTTENLIITESGGIFNAYVNGVQILANYSDTSGFAQFAGTSSTDIATFLTDDTVTGGRESAGGTINGIDIWDGALSAAAAETDSDEAGVFTPPTGSGVPDLPNAAGLLGFAMTGLLAFKKHLVRTQN